MEEKIFNACKNGQIEIIQNYISQGGSINVQDKKKNTLLHVAAYEGNLEMVKYLLNSGATVDIENNKKKTALYLALEAAFENSTLLKPIIETLISAGAGVDIVDNEYYRAGIIVAAQTGDADIVELMVNRGAEVINARDKSAFGRCREPLHYAAEHITTEDPRIFEILLSSGASVNAMTAYGETPLHFLATSNSDSVKKFSLRKIVEVFLKHEALFYLRDDCRRTPMDYAIDACNTEAVEAFILSGAIDVNSKYHSNEAVNGGTILHGACAMNDLPTVKFLLKNGANINALDKSNVSPLQCVIDMLNENDEELVPSQLSLLNYLLKWNPDVNTIVIEGFNILTSRYGFNLQDVLWQTILKHLAKLHVNDYFIHTSLFETISGNPEFDKYFTSCNRELNDAKNFKLEPESFVTLLHLLVDDEKNLYNYAGNLNLVNNFLEIKVEDNFPVYGYSIQKRFLKAVEKRKIWYQAATTLSQFFPSTVDPEHGAVMNILSYLNLENLKKLCQ